MRLYQEELVDASDEYLTEEEPEANSKPLGEEYLLTKAAEQGYITYDDILTAFPEAEENLEELEDVLVTMMESGIKVISQEEKEEREAEAADEPMRLMRTTITRR